MNNCIYRDEFNEPASSYIIKSQESGSRTIVNYNELPEMTVDEFKKIADELGPRSTWFHFEVCLAGYRVVFGFASVNCFFRVGFRMLS